MTSTQKVIKYVAIAFAIFLILSILSAAFAILQTFSYTLGLTKNDNVTEKMSNSWVFTEEISSPTYLDVDLAFSNLTIVEDANFFVETNSKYITCKQENNKMKIEDNRHNFAFNPKSSEVIIHIPSDLNLDKTSISNGAGTVKISYLKTNKLDLDLGAGKTTIDTIIASSSDITTGAGSFTLKNGSLGKLDFEVGVGSASLTTSISADSEITSGVGELNINLLGPSSNYCIKAEKGIGSISIAGKKVSSEEIIGKGPITLEIEGGVGNIKVEFKEE